MDSEQLVALVRGLAEEGAEGLRALPGERLWGAWKSSIDQLLDRSTRLRRALVEVVAPVFGLSPEGWAAALEAVLEPLGREPARDLLLRARPAASRQPALVVLAGNVPGLALQALLPALAARRPLIFKSARAERCITPAFLSLLASHEPALGKAMAALYWRGGERDLDRSVAAHCDPIAVYGDRAAIEAWRALAAERLFAFGPKLSLAIVGRDTDLELICAGVARDVALFDQRGCLSVQLLLTDAPLARTCRVLADALREVATVLPPGPIDTATAAAAAALRDRAILAGRPVAGEVDTGLVVASRPPLRPSPGLRLVRVYPIDPLAECLRLLRPLRGQLQGVVIEGAAAQRLESELVALGVSRCSRAGELQRPDALWRNGGVDLLSALGAALDAAEGASAG